MFLSKDRLFSHDITVPQWRVQTGVSQSEFYTTPACYITQLILIPPVTVILIFIKIILLTEAQHGYIEYRLRKRDKEMVFAQRVTPFRDSRSDRERTSVLQNRHLCIGANTESHN